MAREKDDGYIRFRCKECGKKLKVKAQYEGGHVIACPRCHSTITVPIAGPDAMLNAAVSAKTPAGDVRPTADPSPSQREKAEDAARELQVAAGGRRWRPDASLNRLQELDRLRATLGRLDDETVERIQRMLRQPKLEEDEISLKMRRIAEQRAEAIQDAVTAHSNEIKSKIRQLEARRTGLPEPAFRGLDRLKKALVALDLYARIVLRLGQ